MEVFDVPPQQALYVGDSPHIDIESARRVGMGAVLLDRHGAHDGHQPRLPSLSALLDFLASAP